MVVGENHTILAWLQMTVKKPFVADAFLAHGQTITPHKSRLRLECGRPDYGGWIPTCARMTTAAKKEKCTHLLRVHFWSGINFVNHYRYWGELRPLGICRSGAEQRRVEKFRHFRLIFLRLSRKSADVPFTGDEPQCLGFVCGG